MLACDVTLPRLKVHYGELTCMYLLNNVIVGVSCSFLNNFCPPKSSIVLSSVTYPHVILISNAHVMFFCGIQNNIYIYLFLNLIFKTN